MTPLSLYFLADKNSHSNHPTCRTLIYSGVFGKREIQSDGTSGRGREGGGAFLEDQFLVVVWSWSVCLSGWTGPSHPSETALDTCMELPGADTHAPPGIMSSGSQVALTQLVGGYRMKTHRSVVPGRCILLLCDDKSMHLSPQERHNCLPQHQDAHSRPALCIHPRPPFSALLCLSAF